MRKASIIGSGIYLPQNVVSNEQLENVLSLRTGSIFEITGIRERRWTTSEETIPSMAVEASVMAVKSAGIKGVDRIIVCRDLSITERAHSISLPIIESLSKLGIDVNGTFSIDISNYCPTFVHALHIAELMVRYDGVENILVVAPVDYTDIINTDQDFNAQFENSVERAKAVQQYSLGENGYFQAPKLNAFLWGCGAGAVVVGSSGSGSISRYEACGSKRVRYDSYGIGRSNNGRCFASLDGPAIYRFAMTEIPRFIKGYLEKYEMKLSDIDLFIPHQPNPRMLYDLAKKLGIPKEKMLVICDSLGNINSASIPITYHLNKESGRIFPGAKILFCSFGDQHLTVNASLIVEGGVENQIF